MWNCSSAAATISSRMLCLAMVITPGMNMTGRLARCQAQATCDPTDVSNYLDQVKTTGHIGPRAGPPGPGQRRSADTMSRLILTALGGDISETVALEKDPELAPGPEDLLVAVEAAPVNPADFLLPARWYAVRPETPFALGAEGVGRVIEVGTAVDRTLV